MEGTAGANGLHQKEADEHVGNCKKAHGTCAVSRGQVRKAGGEVAEVSQAEPR